MTVTMTENNPSTNSKNGSAPELNWGNQDISKGQNNGNKALKERARRRRKTRIITRMTLKKPSLKVSPKKKN